MDRSAESTATSRSDPGDESSTPGESTGGPSATLDGTGSSPAASPVIGETRLRAWHVAGTVLVLAVGGLLLYGLWPVITGEAEGDPAREVEASVAATAATVDAVVVRPTSFPIRTQASGHLIPWHRAEISTETGGPVVERPVEEGDVVAEGDLLLRIDDREERIALEEARAELLKAQAQYAVEARPLPSAEADTSDLAAARRAYRETQRQFAEGAALREEVQNARRRYESARVRAGLEREAVQAAQTGLMAAEQAVARARLNLERTRVTAPFAGRVANLRLQTGQRVAPGEPVATLLQDRRLKVEVDVLESDVVGLQQGATAQVYVPALGGPSDPQARLEGTIWAINPQVDAETGTARVTVAVPNPERRLVAGLYADVRLETGRLSDRLVVHDDAVLVRQGRDLVFVVEDGRAQWTYVDVGARSGAYAEITSGVAPGDTVAVDGHYALAHDAPVRVQAANDFAVE